MVEKVILIVLTIVATTRSIVRVDQDSHVTLYSVVQVVIRAALIHAILLVVIMFFTHRKKLLKHI